MKTILTVTLSAVGGLVVLFVACAFFIGCDDDWEDWEDGV